MIYSNRLLKRFYPSLFWLLLFAIPVVFAQQPDTVRFAVIGDYGLAGQPEQDVANLVKSWNPDFIVTVGDNNYPSAEASTIDQNIGQYYHDFIFPYRGRFGSGAITNRFFPSLGNHDWGAAGAQSYLNYFTLPGNGRYYDVVRGPVHFFAIDSDPNEPDGNTSGSRQGLWLKSTMADSAVPWKLVYFHHPPYSSGAHDPSTWMRWPFQAWGANAVLTGHDHIYERLLIDGFPYFVDGLGGESIASIKTPIAGSQVRYNGDYGALLVDASPARLTFQFINRAGALIDNYIINSRLPNPSDDPQFFVRQHYVDFLNREPDQSGLQFWTNQILSCGADTQCIDLKRTNVSAAYYLSTEFQETGYLVHRFYKAAYGRNPRYQEFTPDTQTIGSGVIVGQSGYQDKLEVNKQSFTNAFVNRSAFRTQYPDSLTNAQFVDALNQNTGSALAQSARDALVNGLDNGMETRATVLRKVAENQTLYRREFNPAFVEMEYFGYLRRNPDDAPDGNLNGYNFWLSKLNSFNGDYIRAEMVRAFILSSEYRQRFGQP